MEDICCIGHITRDRIVTPRFTAYNAGGTAYYVAWAISHLRDFTSPIPSPTFSVVTSVSREVMPEVEKLRQAGVSVTAYESKTNVFFENAYSENMDNRRQRVLEKSEPFTVSQLSCCEASVFHLGTLLADDFPPEVVEYLAKKGEVSIDVQGYLRKVTPIPCPSLQPLPTPPKGVGKQIRNSPLSFWKRRRERLHPLPLPLGAVESVAWPDKLRLLRHTTILKVNEFEYQSLTGMSDPHMAAEQIYDWGVREVIITLGGGGSLIYADGHFYETPAYPPHPLVDATGCGDTYSAGYLYCRALGMDYADRGRFAAAMCTLKLEHTGPFSHTVEDVMALLGYGTVKSHSR